MKAIARTQINTKADLAKGGKTAPAPRQSNPSGPRGWRTRCFRVVAVVAIPFLVLLTAEASLRLAGCGYPTDFFLERQVNGHASLIDNQEFGRRFFPPGLVRYPRPMVLPATKPTGTLRIVVLGESAAMGDPEPRFGLPRMLEVLLRERFPEREIEVVNASMVAINSHVILPIARECARRQGDLWVIYMGNNEMIGPFGCISKFGAQAPPGSFIRANLLLKTTRVGQAMDALVFQLRRGRQPPLEWGGMSIWEGQEVHAEAPSTARVYEHFEENLRAILHVGRRAGVPIILCPVANNLKDCAPFSSRHAAALTAEQLKAWQTAYQQGLVLEGQGSFTEASVCYERALALDRQFADLCFRAARCSLALGHAAQAQSLFREARDRDALQFRADSRINEIIRRCALSDSGQGVHLLDAEQLIATASPQSLAGNEHFYEHVHLNPAGNYLLARAVAERAAVALDLGPSHRAQHRLADETLGAKAVGPAEWASETACLEALGFTDWNRHQILDCIRERMERPPFTHQINHDEQLAALRQEIQQGRSATKPVQMQRASQQAAQAVARWPEDWDLRWNLAELLDTSNNAPAAEEQWRAVIRLLPHAPLPYYNLGKLLDSHGRAGDALKLYRQSLLVKPDSFEARYALGSLLCREREPGEALPHLRRAVQQQPRSSEAHLALGVAYRLANRTTEAARQFREVIQLDPNNVQARQFLGPTAPTH
jgi:tetratricopeptide (TPR) repeat protein